MSHSGGAGPRPPRPVDGSPTRPAARRPTIVHLPTWSRLRVASKQRTQLGRGGDFFEIFQHRDGRVSVVMADVSGNGPTAAGPVSDARWVLRQQLARGEPPAAVLSAVNDWLASQRAHEQFVTALCACVDVAAGRAHVASAGHLGPFIKRASGAAEGPIPSAGLALGILGGQTYQETAVKLQPEDALVLVTDGISDRFAVAGDPLGEQGLQRRLAAAPTAPVPICDALLGADAPSDQDATVIVLQVPPRHRRLTPVP